MLVLRPVDAAHQVFRVRLLEGREERAVAIREGGAAVVLIVDADRDEHAEVVRAAEVARHLERIRAEREEVCGGVSRGRVAVVRRGDGVRERLAGLEACEVPEARALRTVRHHRDARVERVLEARILERLHAHGLVRGPVEDVASVRVVHERAHLVERGLALRLPVLAASATASERIGRTRKMSADFRGDVLCAAAGFENRRASAEPDRDFRRMRRLHEEQLCGERIRSRPGTGRCHCLPPRNLVQHLVVSGEVHGSAPPLAEAHRDVAAPFRVRHGKHPAAVRWRKRKGCARIIHERPAPVTAGCAPLDRRARKRRGEPFKFLGIRWRLGERRIRHCGQKYLPQVLQRLAHRRTGVHRQHRILIRHDHGKLPVGPGGTVAAVRAAPELEAIPGLPVIRHRIALEPVRAGRVGYLLRRGERHIVARKELPPVPFAALQPELPETGDVTRRHVETPSAEILALRTAVPLCVRDAERPEQPPREILRRSLAAFQPDDRGKHVRGAAVIAEPRSGAPRHRVRKERLDPIAVLRLRHRRRGILLVTGRHAQQVAHAHLKKVLGRVGRQLVRKQIRDPLVEIELPLVRKHPDRRGCEGLRERVEHVQPVRLAWTPPPFCDRTPMTQQHESVETSLRVHDAHPFRNRA